MIATVSKTSRRAKGATRRFRLKVPAKWVRIPVRAPGFNRAYRSIDARDPALVGSIGSETFPSSC